MPTYVVSKPVDEDAAVTDVRLFSIAGKAPNFATRVAEADGHSLLEVDSDEGVRQLTQVMTAVPVGSHASSVAHP